MHLKDATILLVDDEPDLRTIIAEWFKREGSRVLVAEDGAEALNIIQANQVDVVVSDVRMPVMDGITLLKKVKASGYKSSVMFVSGFTDVIKPRESYDLGVEAVMSKPVERKQLIAAVASLWAAEAFAFIRPSTSRKARLICCLISSLTSALSLGRASFAGQLPRKPKSESK